jgi:hypothetical protein
MVDCCDRGISIPAGRSRGVSLCLQIYLAWFSVDGYRANHSFRLEIFQIAA